MVVTYTYLVSPDFNSDNIPEGYTWDVDAFQELVKATDKATADDTIYTYGGPQGGADVDYLNAADLTISSLKYDGDGEVVGTTVTANAFNNTGTVTTDGTIIFSVKSFTNFGEFDLDKNGVLTATSAVMNMEGSTINLNPGSTLEVRVLKVAVTYSVSFFIYASDGLTIITPSPLSCMIFIAAYPIHAAVFFAYGSAIIFSDKILPLVASITLSA